VASAGGLMPLTIRGSGERHISPAGSGSEPQPPAHFRAFEIK